MDDGHRHSSAVSRGPDCMEQIVQIHSVWVPEILSPSCDLRVFVDQAAEAVPPQNPDISPRDWCAPGSGGRILVECPVRPAGVVMVEVLAQDQPQVPFAGDQHPVRHSRLALAIRRSAIASPEAPGPAS